MTYLFSIMQERSNNVCKQAKAKPLSGGLGMRTG
jgi:hypothetical protein